MSSFIIIGINCLFVQLNRCIKYIGEILVSIPSNKFVARSGTRRRTYLIAIGNSEVHLLVFRTPIKRSICSSIGMQEHTVLNLTPLCVYSDTSNRHGCPCIWRCTTFIQIPTFKDIPFFTCRKVRNIVLIFVRNRSPLTNQSTFMQKDVFVSLVLYTFVVSVYIVAVKISDLILLTIIKEVQMI